MLGTPPTRADSQTTWRYWLALFAVATALRFSFVAVVWAPQVSDAKSYSVQGQRFTLEFPGKKPYYWPPGRSLCLAAFYRAFGSSEFVTKVNAIVFDVANVLLIAIIAHRLLLFSSAARLAGWLAAFYPPAIMLVNWAYSQNVAECFLLSSAALLLAAFGDRSRSMLRRWGLCFLAGLAMGGAILTRPSTLSVFMLVALSGAIMALVRDRQSSCAARVTLPAGLRLGVVSLVSGGLLLVIPCMAHNAHLGAGWVVSTNNERNFFLGNNPYTPCYKTSHWGQRSAAKAKSEQVRNYFASFEAKANPRKAMVLEGLRFSVQRPDLFALRTANRLRSYWGFDYIAARLLQQHYQLDNWALLPLLAMEAGGYLMVVALALIGIFSLRGRGSIPTAWFLLGLVFAYQLPYSFVFAAGTYHFPVMGFLFPFAAITLDEFQRNRASFWREIKTKRWLWMSMALLIVMQIEYAYFAIVWND